MSTEDESSKENSNANVFCVPSKYAKMDYFLDTGDLKSIKYVQQGGRYYGGLFKLYQPAALEALAIKKYGNGGVERLRKEREEKYQRKLERERQKEQEEKQKELERKKELERRAALERELAPPPCAGELYRIDHRSAFRKRNRDLATSEVDKLINKQYKSLPSSDRAVYNKRARMAKKEHEVRKKAHEAKMQERLRAMDRERPEQPPSYWELYRREHRQRFREKNKSASQQTIDKMINQQFRSLPESEQAIWRAQAKKFRAEYGLKFKAFKKKWGVFR